MSAIDKILNTGDLDRACPAAYAAGTGSVTYLFSVEEIKAARAELALLLAVSLAAKEGARKREAGSGSFMGESDRLHTAVKAMDAIK